LTMWLLSLCVLACVSSPCVCEENILHTEYKESLGEAIAGFAQSIYSHLATSSNQDNFVFSPLSLHSALSLLYLATRDNSSTQEQLRVAMGMVNSQQLVKTAYNMVIDSYRNQSSFAYGNHIWVGKDIQLDEAYNEAVTNNFDSGVSKLEFERREAVVEVNNWIKNLTNNEIQNLVDSFTANTQMFIANALYFKEDWLIPFNEEDFEEKQLMVDFETPSGKAKIPMIWQETDKIRYFVIENERLEIVTIPYKNDIFEMKIIIPSGIDHLLRLEDMMKQREGRDQHFDTSNNAFNFFKDLAEIYEEEYEEVKLTIPKFIVRSKFNAADALIALGAKDMFSIGADFDKIVAGGLISVGDILHEACVEVSKNGTEGSAATGIEVTLLSFGSQKEVIVDRPFIFIIQDKINKIPVLVGRMKDPRIENP